MKYIVLFVFLLASCSPFGVDQTELDARKRSEQVQQTVENYVAGRIGPDQALLEVLQAYKEMREVPSPGPMDGVWEILGIAIGTAVPAAGAAVTVLNKRRNTTRAAELASRDEEMKAIKEAIASLKRETK